MWINRYFDIFKGFFLLDDGEDNLLGLIVL